MYEDANPCFLLDTKNTHYWNPSSTRPRRNSILGGFQKVLAAVYLVSDSLKTVEIIVWSHSWKRADTSKHNLQTFPIFSLHSWIYWRNHLQFCVFFSGVTFFLLIHCRPGVYLLLILKLLSGTSSCPCGHILLALHYFIIQLFHHTISSSILLTVHKFSRYLWPL